MFDSITKECKLLTGILNDLKSVCSEFGYERTPDHQKCDVIFDADSEKGCYVCNIDYCLS